jgi:6-pyruvoyltetrahydropterin/6-carboxytetrahydropterin synthase
MAYRDRIEVSFDAGHRLLDYQGKCASPHGHTFRAEVIVEGSELNELGLLVDFGDIKRAMKEWIDRNWDHGFLVNSRDTAMLKALRSIPEAKVYGFEGINPSAEAMARQLACLASERFPGLRPTVRVWESNTQYAEYIPETPQ